jgi:TPR repeat protein
VVSRGSTAAVSRSSIARPKFASNRADAAVSAWDAANCCNGLHLRFIPTLKLSFKFSAENRACSVICAEQTGTLAGTRGRAGRSTEKREADMAEYGMEPKGADDCFALGMKHAAGVGVTIDLVQAHKWFNIAASRGHREAARLRREVAEQMSDGEIGEAQRAARAWLQAHPNIAAPRPALVRFAA